MKKEVFLRSLGQRVANSRKRRHETQANLEQAIAIVIPNRKKRERRKERKKKRKQIRKFMVMSCENGSMGRMR